jgi:poly(U)-specific endoribonuclease
LDNYTPETGEEEDPSDEELEEEERFLNAILKTRVMDETHRFLFNEGKAPREKEEFKDMLREIWFENYSRSANEELIYKFFVLQ